MNDRPRRMDWANINGLPLNGADIAMLAWLILSVLIGLMRGLVFELISLLGWGVAFFGAFGLTPVLRRFLPISTEGSLAGETIAFVCAFVAILILWGLAGRLIRLMIHATPLRMPDRVLGAGFGFARGVIVLLVVATVVGATPLVDSHAWRRSRVASWLNETLQEINPLLPAKLSRHLPASV